MTGPYIGGQKREWRDAKGCGRHEQQSVYRSVAWWHLQRVECHLRHPADRADRRSSGALHRHSAKWILFPLLIDVHAIPRDNRKFIFSRNPRQENAATDVAVSGGSSSHGCVPSRRIRAEFGESVSILRRCQSLANCLKHPSCLQCVERCWSSNLRTVPRQDRCSGDQVS